jgi:nucleoside-diphosphate-sugar epimerase
MRILIVGAAGMLGRKLTQALASRGKLGDWKITGLTLADVVETPKPATSPFPVISLVTDLSESDQAEKLIAQQPDCIFHLAAIVSGDAEANFERGYRVNFDGTRALFEAIRVEQERNAYKPRVVFTSSLAVFGEPFPDSIPDTFFTTPLSSYGTQKAMAELLLSDYSRKGYFDGISIRLPTICIRPGKPNKAASGFYSSILREPLAGKEAVLPVDETLRHWFASPRAAIGFLIHAATLDTTWLGNRRSLTMPGISATVADQIEALRRAAGDAAVRLIRKEPNADIAKIVGGWPRRFDARRAIDLGFKAENSMDEIIGVHREDDLSQA